MSRSNEAPAVSTSRWPTILLLLATTGCGARPFGIASVRSPNAPSWTTALVGAWALADIPSGRGAVVNTPPRDTTVWRFDPGGRLRHAIAVVRFAGDRTTVKERTTELAWWWIESQSVDGVRMPVLCTSARPARNRQCARIDLDTLTTPDSRVTKRFVWSGVTFKSQHWTFIERAETGRR